MRTLPQLKPLTPRELEILHLLQEPIKRAEICDRLCIVNKTYEAHLANIADKLGLYSAARIVIVTEALKRGLLQPDHSHVFKRLKQCQTCGLLMVEDD